MARRKTFNRKRNSKRRSIDSIGSGLLDPDTSVVDEEQTFWWNHLQENTFPPHSLIYSENETARQLNVSSRMDSSQGPSEWWKNLEHSGSEPGPSTSPKRNLSAAIVKTNVLQSSTSESEKELDIRKRKVRLKAANRRSGNNAFLNALDNTEVSVPLKLRMKRVKYSDIYTDLDKEVSQKRLQEDEEDSSNISSTGNILKSKPSIYRRRRGEGTEDQNPFQDILTQDVSNSSTTGKSVVLEKEFSKRSMHRNIDSSKDNADEQRKSTGASQIMPLESIEPEVLKLNIDSSKLLTPNVENVLVSNANEIIQSSDDSDILIINKRLKLKSRFMQRARKSIGKNAFADALADDSSSTSNPNKENDIHESPLMSQSSLSPSKRSVNRSKTKIDITHESSLIRRSPKSSLNATNKQSLDVPVQAKDNIEINSSSSSLDNSEPRRKTSVFLKPKSRILKSLRKGQTKNAFAEIFEEDDISARKTNVSTKDNRVSVERGETTTRISQVHGSLTTDKSPQSKDDEIMSEGDSYDISLTTSSNVEKSISNKSNVSSENKSKLSESDFTNASKSISRKSVVAKTPEKQISSSRKSTREETLKEHTRTNAILPVDRTSTNEIVTHEIINDDLHDDIDIEQDLSTSTRVSKSSPDKEIRLARNNLRNRSETSKPSNIEVHKVIDNLHNDANGERDSSISKRMSKSSSGKETRLTRNSLRNRSKTPNLTDIEVHEVGDNLHNDANRERDSSISKRMSKSSPGKETSLTRNSLRNRSATPNLTDTEVREVVDNLYNDANRERDSGMSKRTSKSSPGKETRLTRNSLRNRSETPNLTDIEVHEVGDNLHNDANRERDSSISKRMSKSSPGKETHLTRNSLRNRSETPNLTDIEVHEVGDNLHNDANRERDSSMSKRASKSSPGKETRLTRNSLRNRSETPNLTDIEVHEVGDNLHNDANRERDSSISKRMSKSSPGKETRLTRNSLRNRSETPNLTDIEVHEVGDNLYNDANRERDSSTSKRASKSSPGKESRLMRNSLRNRSATPNLTDTEVREVVDNLYNDANRERDSSMSKRTSKSSPGKETRLTRNSLKNRSETPNLTDIEVHEVVDNLHNDANRERDSSMSKRLSKSSPGKESLMRNSLRNRSETPKPASKNIELPKRSVNWIADIEEVDNVNADSEKNMDDISQIISSTRISQVTTNIGTHKSTIHSAEIEITDEDADSEKQVIQRNSISTKAGTSNKAVNRQSVQSSNRTSIKENRETAGRQRTLNKSHIYHSTPTKPPSKDTSFSVRPSSSKSLRIDDFFKVKQASTTVNKRSNDRAQNLKSQVFDAEKMEKLKTELEKIKNREMAAMKIATIDKKESALKAISVKPIMFKQATKKKQPIAKPKVVDKAFLVDGKVYKAPRLPRPKHWATDRLYKFLWNRMEPKYKLATRLKSEKFVQKLAKIVSVIERRKNYENYKTEMGALMKEMARLKIINTRSDFYHFCQDFLPYEFRVKVVPMLLPGNKKNIPYDPEKLHTPLLDT